MATVKRERVPRHVHLCSWDAGLGYMKKGDQKFPKKVLAALHACGRFSIFEATENKTIAHVMDSLVAEKMILTDNVSVGYPWTLVRLTAKGKTFAGIE
jgi:hypothetical protein